jgi:hypothetical protein
VRRPSQSRQSEQRPKRNIIAETPRGENRAVPAAGTSLQIRNGAILNWAKDKEDSSKNEQARSSTDHTFGTDRFMPGEEDDLRDDFLGDVPSIRHIAAVSCRQIRDACARQPTVRAIAPRGRIANAC